MFHQIFKPFECSHFFCLFVCFFIYGLTQPYAQSQQSWLKIPLFSQRPRHLISPRRPCLCGWRARLVWRFLWVWSFLFVGLLFGCCVFQQYRYLARLGWTAFALLSLVSKTRMSVSSRRGCFAVWVFCVWGWVLAGKPPTSSFPKRLI